jgi:hypothetical protein
MKSTAVWSLQFKQNMQGWIRITFVLTKDYEEKRIWKTALYIREENISCEP